MIYCSWGMECDEQNLLSFWTLFCTLTSTVTTWKIKHLKKMKKTLGDIIILHMCTINDNHPEIWSTTDTIFFSFWTIFCPFTPLTTRKIKKMKKIEKTQVDIIILHMCFINDNHIMYGSWDMEHNGYNVLSFWTILCPFALLTQCAPHHPPPPFSAVGRGLNLQPNFQKEGLDRTSTFREVLLGKTSDIFQGGWLQFSHKK